MSQLTKHSAPTKIESGRVQARLWPWFSVPALAYLFFWYWGGWDFVVGLGLNSSVFGWLAILAALDVFAVVGLFIWTLISAILVKHGRVGWLIRLTIVCVIITLVFAPATGHVVRPLAYEKGRMLVFNSRRADFAMSVDALTPPGRALKADGILRQAPVPSEVDDLIIDAGVANFPDGSRLSCFKGGRKGSDTYNYFIHASGGEAAKMAENANWSWFRTLPGGWTLTVGDSAFYVIFPASAVEIEGTATH